jgi:hypothetical protein
MAEQPEPELIGASEQPARLDPGARVPVRMERADRWRLAARAAEGIAEEADRATATTDLALEGHVFLQLEDVQGGQVPVGVYGVYVNVPEGDDPADHPELKAGLFSTFGLEMASLEGRGMTQAFDITDLARRLAADGRWEPEALTVVLTEDVPASGAEERVANDVHVGRIGIYVVPPA